MTSSTPTATAPSSFRSTPPSNRASRWPSCARRCPKRTRSTEHGRSQAEIVSRRPNDTGRKPETFPGGGQEDAPRQEARRQEGQSRETGRRETGRQEAGGGAQPRRDRKTDQEARRRGPQERREEAGGDEIRGTKKAARRGEEIAGQGQEAARRQAGHAGQEEAARYRHEGDENRQETGPAGAR